MNTHTIEVDLAGVGSGSIMLDGQPIAGLVRDRTVTSKINEPVRVELDVIAFQGARGRWENCEVRVVEHRFHTLWPWLEELGHYVRASLRRPM